MAAKTMDEKSVTKFSQVKHKLNVETMPKRSCESDLLESIKHTGAEDFKDLFSLPEEFRAVAYLPPSHVVVDIIASRTKRQGWLRVAG